MANVEDKNNTAVGIKPEAVEVVNVKIEGENPNLKPDDDFISVKTFRSSSSTAQSKRRKNKRINAAIEAAKKKQEKAAEEKKQKDAEPVEETNNVSIEDVPVVGKTKDGQDILEGVIVSETSKEEIKKEAEEKKEEPKAETSDAKGKDVVVAPTGINKSEKIVKFREKCKADLSAVVQMSIQAKSFKSKVYGGMIIEWADSAADIIEQVLLKTVDLKFIDTYNKYSEGIDNSKGDEFDMILRPKVKYDPKAPFDIDEIEFKRIADRAFEANRKLYQTIEDETFSIDTFEERFETFLGWAKENPLLLMMDGPEGCKVGYRDMDGNIYNTKKEPFVPKADKVA